MKEVWKDVEGYEGIYQVSDMGRVRSLARKGKLSTELMGIHSTTLGYKFCSLSLNGKTKHKLLHRLVAIAFISNPEGKETVNHKDGDKSNNAVINLEWATRSENVQHGYDNGLLVAPKGQSHYAAKLSRAKVMEIRAMYDSGNYTQAEIGNIFNVGQSQARRIIHRLSWKHI